MEKFWLGMVVSLMFLILGYWANRDQKRAHEQIFCTGVSILALLTAIGYSIIKALKIP
jgi:hypothetical protein